jgi:hypothetical protein
MSAEHSRPWFVSDRACDDYRETLTRQPGDGGDLEMLKLLKKLRSIIVNVGIVAISLYSLSLGGDPTTLGIVGLLVLGAYNGLEYSDYRALLQAYKEVQNADGSDGND